MNTKEHIQELKNELNKLQEDMKTNMSEAEKILERWKILQKKGHMIGIPMSGTPDPYNPHGLSYRAAPAKEDLLRDGD